MIHVQVPMKINGGYFSYNTISKKLINFLSMWRIAIIESNSNFSSGLLLGIKNSLALLLVCCKWFFSDNISARLHSFNDKLIVRCIDGCYNQPVRLYFLHHLIEVCVGWTGNVE